MSPASNLSRESFGIGTLFDRLTDALIVVDLATSRIVLCNGVAEAIFGRTESELLGRPITTILPGGLPGDAASPLALAGLGPHGEPLWLEASLSPIENQRLPGTYVLALVRDVAERRRVEAELASSEARFRAFMDNGPAIASMRDEAGRYVYTNAMHRRLFGSDDWIGVLASNALPDAMAQRVLADDRLVLQSGTAAHFEEQMPGPDGPLTFMVFKFPFHDGGGRGLVGALGIDITGLKRTQAALMERTAALEGANAALRAADHYKDEFLSVVSHELRTPITAIAGFTEFLEDGVGGALSPEQQTFVTQIEKATDRLRSLITDLIDFAQLRAGFFQLHIQEADLVAAIREMAVSLQPRAEEAGVALRITLPPGPVWAPIDARQIGRVVGNMITNALTFTPAGGIVTVRAAMQGARLVTEVADTGVGIAPEHQPKLFDRFWQSDTSSTRQAGGLGLGLPIAKAIIDGHGGAIGARSVPGAGSTFWFALDTAPAAS
jgi:signal transduction histidine kinase